MYARMVDLAVCSFVTILNPVSLLNRAVQLCMELKLTNFCLYPVVEEIL